MCSPVIIHIGSNWNRQNSLCLTKYCSYLVESFSFSLIFLSSPYFLSLAWLPSPFFSLSLSLTLSLIKFVCLSLSLSLRIFFSLFSLSHYFLFLSLSLSLCSLSHIPFEWLYLSHFLLLNIAHLSQLLFSLFLSYLL